MKTREELKVEIENLRILISDLEAEEIDLCKQYVMAEGNDVRYEEKTTAIGGGKSGRNPRRILKQGTLYFTEFFTDGDTGKKIPVERSLVVKTDDVWDEFNLKRMKY
jgi:hypothetical protein